MYKSLSPASIGIWGRQSELLEAALTHRFEGLEIDFAEIVRKAQSSGVPAACRYLTSASLKIGPCELPVRWAGSDEEFHADLGNLQLALNVAEALGARRFLTSVPPTSSERPFHDNFKFAVARLQKVAELLAVRNITLGLALQAAAEQRADGGYQFIYQAEPLVQLVNSIGAENVGLHLDTWHWHVGGGSIETLAKLKPGQIHSVHLADAPADADLETIMLEQRLLPGEGGAIDLAAIVKHLSETNFDGPIAIAPNASVFPGQNREETVGRQAAIHDELWTAAGLGDGANSPAVAADAS
jgi:sugar phosphate isomerase/epimerase